MASRRRHSVPSFPLVALLLGALLLGARWGCGEQPSPVQASTPHARPAAPQPLQALPLGPAPEPRAAAPGQGSAPARDPLLALMPATVKHSAFVAELNAILNSDLGGLFADCYLDPNDRVVAQLRDAGFDPAARIDRVALVDETLVLSGDFAPASWRRFVPPGTVSKGYGKKGELLEVPAPDGGAAWVGAWGGQVLIFGGSARQTQAYLDRLEGNGPPAPGVLDGAMGSAAEELFGVLTAEALAEVFDAQDPQLARALRSAGTSTRVHGALGRDLSVVASLEGDDPGQSREVKQQLSGLLGAFHLARGGEKGGSALDYVTLRDGEKDGAFALEVSLPHAFMEAALRRCVAARTAAAPDAGSER